VERIPRDSERASSGHRAPGVGVPLHRRVVDMTSRWYPDGAGERPSPPATRSSSAQVGGLPTKIGQIHLG
jgi:hypothetical protein